MHPDSEFLKEVLMVKLLITRKNLLNITDRMCIYQLLECVLSNVLSILLRHIIHKNFKLSFELKTIDQE